MKAVTRIESHADLLIAQAVDTLVSTYAQSKLVGDVGNYSRAKFARIVQQRAMKLHSRGWPWRYIRATDATVPQQ
jgi:hypothetical protein